MAIPRGDEHGRADATSGVDPSPRPEKADVDMLHRADPEQAPGGADPDAPASGGTGPALQDELTQGRATGPTDVSEDPPPGRQAGADPRSRPAGSPRAQDRVDQPGPMDDPETVDLHEAAPGPGPGLDGGQVGDLGDAVADRAVVGQAAWQPRQVTTLVLGVAGGLLLASLAGAVISRVRGLLISLVVALFISFALEPAVKWMHDRGMSRGAATGVLFAATIVGVTGFFAAMVPLIVDQTTTLVDRGPEVINGIAAQARSLPGELGERVPEWLDGLEGDLPSRIPALAGTASRGALNVGATVVGSLFNILTIALVAFYMAADGPRLRRVVSSNMQPSAQHDFLEIWEVAVDKTGGYLYSRVITAVVSAIFHTVVFLLIDLDYALALGIWVGVVSSIVPVVGTYLAGILPVAIALASSVGAAAWVLGAIVAYQQVENYLIAPRITSHTVSLHPAVAFISVLAGASLLGAFGALLAIPVAAIISALWTARREVHDVVHHDLTRPNAATPWLERQQ